MFRDTERVQTRFLISRVSPENKEVVILTDKASPV